MYNVFQPGISSNLDDRTLHELYSTLSPLTCVVDKIRLISIRYLWPFAEGVRSGVGAVMIAYNAVCMS